MGVKVCHKLTGQRADFHPDVHSRSEAFILNPALIIHVPKRRSVQLGVNRKTVRNQSVRLEAATSQPGWFLYLRLLLQLLLQVVEVCGISIIILGVEPFLQSPFLLQTFVLLNLFIVHLYLGLFIPIIIILCILQITQCIRTTVEMVNLTPSS